MKKDERRNKHMKQKQKTRIFVAMLAMVLFAGIVSAAYDADEGGITTLPLFVNSGKFYAALEEGNYESWKAVVEESLTKDRFEELQAWYKNRQQSDRVTAELRRAWATGDEEEMARLKEEYYRYTGYADDADLTASRGSSGCMAYYSEDFSNTPEFAILAKERGMTVGEYREQLRKTYAEGDCIPNVRYTNSDYSDGEVPVYDKTINPNANRYQNSDKPAPSDILAESDKNYHSDDLVDSDTAVQKEPTRKTFWDRIFFWR